MEYTEAFLKDQREFLEDLIAFREPLDKLAKRDKIGQAWDQGPENPYLATLTRQDLISILQRFLNYDLSAQDVYDWAEALEVRETVKKELGYNSLIFEVLSNITLEFAIDHPLTPERAKEIIHQLQTAPFDPDDD
jgi:hypothetical protein